MVLKISYKVYFWSNIQDFRKHFSCRDAVKGSLFTLDLIKGNLSQIKWELQGWVSPVNFIFSELAVLLTLVAKSVLIREKFGLRIFVRKASGFCGKMELQQSLGSPKFLNRRTYSNFAKNVSTDFINFFKIFSDWNRHNKTILILSTLRNWIYY